jgi:hypothetical protein
VPLPPDSEPPTPVEEPPDRPQQEPPAPVREPDPTPPDHLIPVAKEVLVARLRSLVPNAEFGVPEARYVKAQDEVLGKQKGTMRVPERAVCVPADC